MRPRLVVAAAAGVALATPSRSRAGGLEGPDLGTVAMGRGTAFVAKADNSSAFYYNPAGLSKQPRGNVLLSANLIQMSVRFQRTGTDGCLIPDDVSTGCLGGFDPALDYSQTRIRNEAGVPVADPAAVRPYPVARFEGIGPAPLLAGSFSGIGKAQGLSLGLGVVPSSSFGTPRYDANGPQRYMIQKAQVLTFFPGVALAYNVNRYFQVGVAALAGMTVVDIKRAVRLGVQPDDTNFRNEDLGGDAQMQVVARDLFMPTAILGVLSNPTDWLEVGLSVRLPTRQEARGTVNLRGPDVDDPDATVAGDDSVVLRQEYPWVVRAGVRYIHRYFDLELDVVYEARNRLEPVEMDFMDCDGPDFDTCTHVETMSGPVSLDDAVWPRDARDTYSVRLGSDVSLWPGHLTARAGAFYQSSALSRGHSTMSLELPFAQQVGVGGGLTWHAIQYLDLSVGFLHVIQPKITVTDGTVQQQTNPITSPDGELLRPGNVVNNGVYEVALNLFGASFQGHF